MSVQVMWSWLCQPCDVEGRDGGDSAPGCWNCGGPVVVTARPTVSDDDDDSDDVSETLSAS